MKIKKEDYEKKGFVMLDGAEKYEICDTALETITTITIFGKQYEITLIVKVLNIIEEGWEVEEELREYAKKFLDGIDYYLEKAMDEIENYYHTTIKEEAEEGFCEYVEIEERNQLSQFLTPYGVYIFSMASLNGSRSSRIKLVFECDWYEDEFMVKYDKDCNIEEVGPLW